jgi:indole-3-glycerol phosphate synthase
VTVPTADFLSRIASDRRRRVEEMRARAPGHTLRAQLEPTRAAGRLERALRRGGGSAPLRIMCEFKRASPSKGVLRAEADPVSYARLYEAGGAAAMSIVTEPDHFQGDVAWVAPVRAAVGLPLLLKDFVIDGYQVLDAAVRGADGVLLLASLLSDVQLQILITEARLLGLDALVEVHDEDELRPAIRAGEADGRQGVRPHPARRRARRDRGWRGLARIRGPRWNRTPSRARRGRRDHPCSARGDRGRGNGRARSR